jgi:hypothetical protein
MRRPLTIALVAVPGLLLAAVGSFVHPAFLDASTARAWWTVHVFLVPAFPLIALALWLLLRGVAGPVAALARAAAYGFATFYTALDVLSGIGAGLVVEAGAGDLAGRLFLVGDALGAAGVWMLLAAAVLTGLALLPRDGPRVLPGAAVLAGACYPFLTGHIFHPTGVVAMLLVALGCALVAAARREPALTADPVGSR